MYGGNHPDPNVMYYLTVYNEPIVQPAEPEGVDVEGIVRGIHRLSESTVQGPKAQLLASGVVRAVDHSRRRSCSRTTGACRPMSGRSPAGPSCAATASPPTSTTSSTPMPSAARAYVTQKLSGVGGPFVAVSDFMHAVPDQIRAFVPGDYATLGADDFGFSDTRPAARRFFKIDGPSIVVRTLELLADRGEVDRSLPAQAIEKYRLHDVNAGTTGSAGGES